MRLHDDGLICGSWNQHRAVQRGWINHSGDPRLGDDSVIPLPQYGDRQATSILYLPSFMTAIVHTRLMKLLAIFTLYAISCVRARPGLANYQAILTPPDRQAEHKSPPRPLVIWLVFRQTDGGRSDL